MSFNSNYDSRNHPKRSYDNTHNSSRNHGHYRDRSRDQYNNYDKHKSQNHSRPGHLNFNQYENKNHNQYQGNTKILREVFPIDIGNPKVYLIWKYDKNQLAQGSKQRFVDFNPKITKGPKPPSKTQAQSSRLGQLKNAITPVEQIWSQLIKQYLNDSEFVQIYRKKNSLSYGNADYSKSIIHYDGTNRKKFYNNQQTQYNIFSRAYFKLWQILSLGILDSKRQEDITIANLAEGPGGFIHSLIDYRLKQNKTLQDRYYAITLKIEQGKTRMAKDWSDYRGHHFFQLISDQGYKVKLSYGQTGDGNLYNVQNIQSFKSHVMEGREAFLVTGDGGIQCIGDDEFHYQEIFNAKLFFSQIITAMRIQQVGGTFILKIYDVHFEITNQLIMLLCVFYRKVGLIKPLTSRPGNSEKYVLCEGFFGISQDELAKLDQLLREWHKTEDKLSYFENIEYLHQILSFIPKDEKMSKFEETIRYRIKLVNGQLSREQELKIEEGLQLIKKHDGNKGSIKREIQQKRVKYQISYAYEWCKKYGLKHIEVKPCEKKE